MDCAGKVAFRIRSAEMGPNTKDVWYWLGNHKGSVRVDEQMAATAEIALQTSSGGTLWYSSTHPSKMKVSEGCKARTVYPETKFVTDEGNGYSRRTSGMHAASAPSHSALRLAFAEVEEQTVRLRKRAKSWYDGQVEEHGASYSDSYDGQIEIVGCRKIDHDSEEAKTSGMDWDGAARQQISGLVQEHWSAWSRRRNLVRRSVLAMVLRWWAAWIKAPPVACTSTESS